jgi:C1q domain
MSSPCCAPCPPPAAPAPAAPLILTVSTNVATLSATATGVFATFPFNVVACASPTAAFDTTFGRFVAPTAGTYGVAAQVSIGGGSTLSLALAVNGAQLPSTLLIQGQVSASDSCSASIPLYLLSLKAGDLVAMQYNATAAASILGASFSVEQVA